MHKGETLSIAYELEQQTGQDDVGTVFVGRNTQTNRRVTLRLINPELANDRSLVLQAFEDALRASRLSHRHFTAAHELGWMPDGRPFIVSEHIDGMSSLAMLLRRDGPFEEARAGWIGLELCRALSAIHADGLLHGALTPGRVFILGPPHAPSQRVVLRDLGLARLRAIERTPADTVYLAPEQRHHDLDLDQRADLYAVGALLYELSTGIPPMTVAERGDPLARPDPAWQLGSHISEEFSALLDRALQPEREDRFPTADDLARELTAFAEEHEVEEEAEADKALETIPVSAARPPDRDLDTVIDEAAAAAPPRVLTEPPRADVDPENYATIPVGGGAPSSIPPIDVDDADVLAADTIPPRETEIWVKPGADSDPPAQQEAAVAATSNPVDMQPPSTRSKKKARSTAKGREGKQPRNHFIALGAVLVLLVIAGSALGAAVMATDRIDAVDAGQPAITPAEGDADATNADGAPLDQGDAASVDGGNRGDPSPSTAAAPSPSANKRTAVDISLLRR